MKRRNKSILIKLTEAEREAWRCRAQSEGLTVADLIRSRMATKAVGRSPIPRRVRRPATAPAELVAQVARLGNNLNQIARHLNRGAWGPGDRVAVLTALATIERGLGRLLASWTPRRGGDAN